MMWIQSLKGISPWIFFLKYKVEDVQSALSSKCKSLEYVKIGMRGASICGTVDTSATMNGKYSLMP